MPYSLDPEVDEFIRKLPKTETHLHIEGALPYELLRQLDAVKFGNPPVSWRHDFRFRDFAHFEGELLGMAMAWHTSPERYHESAKIIFQRHLNLNVRYVEASFASGVVEFLGLPADEILAAILEAVPEGLEVRVFLGIHHNGYTRKMGPILEECLSYDGLAGIDLHGTEDFPLEEWTPGYYQRAREAGKFTKAHAGEHCGADFVKRVVEELGVQRIEHGVRAIESPSVVDLLKERNIALDVCPISNIKLNVAPDMASHQLRRLTEAGVKCTLSTDDPISFGNTLVDEYAAAYRYQGFDKAGLVQLAKNGFEIALAPEDYRQKHIAKLDAVAGELETSA